MLMKINLVFKLTKNPTCSNLLLYTVCLQAGLGCKHKLCMYHLVLLRFSFDLRVIDDYVGIIVIMIKLFSRILK